MGWHLKRMASFTGKKKPSMGIKKSNDPSDRSFLFAFHTAGVDVLPCFITVRVH